MLDQARARNAEANREGRLELLLGSLEELPATDGSFDKVYSANVVQFFADRAAAFANIRIEELAMEPAPAVCIIGEHP